jgi:hypothetical protein
MLMVGLRNGKAALDYLGGRGVYALTVDIRLLPRVRSSYVISPCDTNNMCLAFEYRMRDYRDQEGQSQWGGSFNASSF